MIIRTANGRKAELRSADWGSTEPWRFRLADLYSPAGVAVTEDKVLGLPTVTFCMRLVSDAVAGCDLQVVDVTNPQLPQPRSDTWQYELLHNPPADELTGFNLIGDIASAIDGFGNSCIQKIKAQIPGVTARVLDIRPLDMDRVRIYCDKKTGEKLFDLLLPDGKIRTTDSSEILHIRGWTPKGGIVGMSPIQQHRLALGNVIAQNEYLGRFFRNNATSSGYIGLPTGANPDPKQLKDMLEEWEESHGGDNVHRPAILANGAEWHSIGVNLADVAFLDGQHFAVEEMARMMYVPAAWVQPSPAERTNKIEEKFIELAAYIEPRCKRIKAALNADTDLFIPADKLETRFDFSALYHADQDSTSQRVLRLRQGGITSANEARVMEGLPPINQPEYDLPILLPVGAGAVPGTTVSSDEGTGNGDTGDGETVSPNADEGA